MASCPGQGWTHMYGSVPEGRAAVQRRCTGLAKSLSERPGSTLAQWVRGPGLLSRKAATHTGAQCPALPRPASRRPGITPARAGGALPRLRRQHCN